MGIGEGHEHGGGWGNGLNGSRLEGGGRFSGNGIIDKGGTLILMKLDRDIRLSSVDPPAARIRKVGKKKLRWRGFGQLRSVFTRQSFNYEARDRPVRGDYPLVTSPIASGIS